MGKKRGLTVILFVSVIMMLAACGGGTSSDPAQTPDAPAPDAGGEAANNGEVRTFSFGYDQPQSTGYGIAGEIFREKLEELSGGKMTIAHYPGAQLGSEPEMLQKVRSGDIDFIISSTANATTVAEQSAVFSLHYIFEDEDHLARALADPEVTQALKDMFSESVTGAQVLSPMTLGLRNMYSKDEIQSVDDLNGKKIRVQATRTEDVHMPAYGAQTVHMAFGEVYTSLQTGVMDIAENGINVYLENKHYEVAPILSITQHAANNSVVWASDKVMESLTEEEREWVQAAADEVGKNQPKKALELEAESLAELEELGVKVVKEVDKSGFMEAAEPIQDQLAAEMGPHAEKILQLVRALR